MNFEKDDYDVSDEEKCSCGNIAGHEHDGIRCCGGMMCCPEGNR